MGILAVYDTAGIQNYIFASNKLAENVGGSKLVADVFGTILPAVMRDVTKQPVANWRECGELNPKLEAEIIYQGGGNAFLAFSSKTIFQTITKEFLIRVSKIAPGVGIAVAAIETDFSDNYECDFDKLGKRLAVVKGGFNLPTFAGNQPITKQSGRTGLPVSEFRNEEYLSASQVKKLERYNEYKKMRGSEISDFSDLAFDKGTDSLIAIVHADGNNMGSRIKAEIAKFETYAKAVPKIRELSRRIDNCYKKARERTVEAFSQEYKKYIADQRDKNPHNKNLLQKSKDEPPILELIGDGDDITLVIGGRFALDFAARLLREIEATPEKERPFEDSVPRACAGVVLFGNHYPFSEAYKLAEELCTSAKWPSRKQEGSYIDFHLHQSGNVSGLHRLRERQYEVDGKTLICRPWVVSDVVSKEAPSFKWFEENVQAFKGTDKMPRNKTKALRNAIGAGEMAADIAIQNMRDKQLPIPFSYKMPPTTSKHAHYFDILEFCDAYENLLNKEDEDNAK